MIDWTEQTMFFIPVVDDALPRLQGLSTTRDMSVLEVHCSFVARFWGGRLQVSRVIVVNALLFGMKRGI